MLIHEVSKFTDTVGVYFAAQNIRSIKTAFFLSGKAPRKLLFTGCFCDIKKRRNDVVCVRAYNTSRALVQVPDFSAAASRW